MSKLKNVLLIQYYKEIIFRKIKSIFDTIKLFEKSEFSYLICVTLAFLHSKNK